MHRKSLSNFSNQFSYKTLLSFLFILLIGVVILTRFIFPKQKISAAWWNDNWGYRQAINISSHTSAESNVYIIASINIGTTSKAQTDDGDFRFTDTSGQLLNYFIASGVGTTNITFHILLPSFPAGAQTIYAYYGNSSVSDGFSVSDFSTQASNYTIGSYSSEEISPGPIAYWKFDEGVGTTAYDSSSSQFNGTLGTGSSSPTWIDQSQCISNNCLSFDGTTDYVNSNYDFSSSISDSFSLNFWINPKSVTGSQGVMGKGSAGGYGTLNWEWSVRLTGTTLDFFYWNTSGGGEIILTSSVTLNKWDYFSITYDPINKAKLYKNGILVSTDTYINNAFQNRATPLIFGNAYYNGGVNYHFNGYLDEIKIYRYARTLNQIKQDYNSHGSSGGSSVNLGIKSNTSPSLSDKLVAYYKFNENNGTIAYDSSSNKLNGNITGVTWQTENKCVNGKCLLFNGSSNYINIGTISSLNTFSLSAWIKAGTDVNDYRTIIDKSNSASDRNFWLALESGTGQLSLRFSIGGVSTTYLGNTALNDNKWHYVAATYDNSYVKLYVDGKLDKTPFSKTGIPNTAIINSSIGYQISAGGRYFNGLIDEVKIYNTALTADEIKQDFNQGSAISFGSSTQTIGSTITSLEYCIPGDTTFCDSPVAEYNLEENTGTIAKDTSGNNTNGTIVGATWIPGKIGAGLYLDGNDSIGTTKFNPTAFTFSFWVFPTSYPTNATFLSNRSSATNGLMLFYTGGTLYYRLGDTSAAYSWSTGYLPPLNKWSYLTISRDANGRYIYANGQLKASTTDPGGTSTSAKNVSIGVDTNTNSYYLPAKIDQIRIYNYARTPTQVAYDYNKGGPVGWWKMDECQGSIIHDSSDVNNNGTLSIGQSGTQNSIGTCQIGTSAAWTSGASGHTNASISLDGIDDYITIPDNNSLDPTEITLTAWIKPNVLQTGNIFSKQLNNSYRLRINSSGTISFFDRGGINTINSSATCSSGLWCHIVATGSSSGLKIYINGNLNSQNSTPYASPNVASSLTLGQFQANSEVYSGQMDDVRIYNYALTSEQIKILYNGGSVSFN